MVVRDGFVILRVFRTIMYFAATSKRSNFRRQKVSLIPAQEVVISRAHLSANVLPFIASEERVYCICKPFGKVQTEELKNESF